MFLLQGLSLTDKSYIRYTDDSMSTGLLFKDVQSVFFDSQSLGHIL